MNAGLLLDHYARIADAADAINRLRRFVLDLAMRGKLVEQDAGDEPASELLRQIAAEKAGQKKGGEALSLDGAKEFDVPKGWELVPLGNVVVNHLGGGTPSKANSAYWDGEIRWASVKDVGKSKYLDDTIDSITPEGLSNSSSNLITPGHLVVVTRMGLGKVSINRINVAINQDLRALQFSSGVNVDYAYNFFLTHAFEGTGLTVKGIKVEELLRFPFPLPPLAEQHRIVAKVDELMALCNQLEAARAEREAARDMFTLSTFAKLNTPDPETFGQDARFALANLAPLTTRPDQIKQLRQTILNLAVRGKLVEQDTSDEPSTSIIEEIEELIVNGGRRGKRKASDGEPISTECPAGWHWTKLSLLAMFENGDRSSNYPSGSDIRSEGVPFISTKAIRNHAVSLEAVDFVSPEKFASLRSGKAQHLDILITLRGSVGKFGLFSETDRYKTGFINAQLLILRCLKVELVPFLMTFMRSDGFAEQIRKLSSGSATPQLSAGQLASVELPLPPLAEQRRIVAKVDELMALCNQLEASITTGEQTRSRLLEAVLHNALEPA